MDVEGRKGDAAQAPAPIFDAGHVAAHAEAEWRRLHVLAQTVLSKRERSTEEKLPLLVELRQRRVPSRAIAVDPVVVARREDGRGAERVEVGERLRVDGIRALAGAALQIAVVGREREILPVHVGDQVRHTDGRLRRRVGQITPEPDCVCAVTAPSVSIVSVLESCGGRQAGRDRRDDQHGYGR